MKGKEVNLYLLNQLFSFIFICVGKTGDVLSVCVEAVVGFSDDGSSNDGVWAVGYSRMMYSLPLNFPALSVVWPRWIYPAFYRARCQTGEGIVPGLRE